MQVKLWAFYLTSVILYLYFNDRQVGVSLKKTLRIAKMRVSLKSIAQWQIRTDENY